MLLDRLSARALRERMTVLARDLAMVRAGLAGRHPAPFRVTPGSATPAPSLTPRRTKVAAIERLGPDAIAIRLRDPSGAPLRFRAGQFLTVVVPVAGETLRRAYSIASSPSDEDGVTIGVKRVPGGKVSGWLVDQLRVGDELQVLGPSGEFGLRPADDAAALVLVAGGSGITPILALAHAALEARSHHVTLVFANRTPGDEMFAATLEELARAHGDRFVVRRLFGPLLDPTAFADALPSLERSLVFLCGPAPMMELARQVLLERGLPRAALREERFVAPRRTASATVEGGTLTVRARGRTHVVTVAPRETLLEAGLRAGAPMPFSCAMGGCGACKVRLVDGEVALDAPNCLGADEQAAGEVLTCVGRACGKDVVLEVEP
jgi:ferredoxin-NADP reductase